MAKAPADDDSPQLTVLSGRRLAGAFTAVMVVNTMSGVDATIVSTAAPTITSELGRLSLLPWITSAYLLAQVGSIALYGKLGDIRGRKRVFLGAAWVFLGASIGCGFAQSMPQLIGFRAVQGLGAGGLTALSMALVAEMAPPARVGRYLGYAGLVFAVTSVLGPLTGGLFVDHLSWRWAFFVNLAPGLVGGAFVMRLVPASLPKHHSHRVDYLGAALLAATTTALVLTTSWGGTRYSWGSATFVALVLMTVLGAVAFVVRAQRVAEPLVPLGVLRERTIGLAIMANLVAGMGFTPGIVFLPFVFQAVAGLDATASGFALIPLGLATALTTVAAGHLVERFGGAKMLPAIGMAALAFAYTLLSTIDQATSASFASLCALIAGIGVGCVMQTLLHVVQRFAPPDHLGVATSWVILARITGAAVGVALVGAIFTSRLEAALVAVPGVDAGSVHGDPTSIRALGPEARDAVTAAFAHALADGFRALVPVMGMGLLFVAGLRGGVVRNRLATDPEAAPAGAPQ